MAGDGEINEMRKIKEMSGNNAMLRRERGGEANSGYSPTQDGSCPGEQAKERNTLFRQIHFPIQTKAFSYSDKYIFPFRQIQFPIQTNTFPI